MIWYEWFEWCYDGILDFQVVTHYQIRNPMFSARIIVIQHDFNSSKCEVTIHCIIKLLIPFVEWYIYNAICNFNILLSAMMIVLTDLEFMATIYCWLLSKINIQLRIQLEYLKTVAWNIWTTDAFCVAEIKILKVLGYSILVIKTMILIYFVNIQHINRKSQGSMIFWSAISL
jgi:hypothetical protein